MNPHNHLPKYLHHFTHLKRDRKNGGAPHKPILLLSVIRMFEQGIFKDRRIEIIPELVASFNSHWAQLVTTNHNKIFALPFYHMRSEPFWELLPNPGCDTWINSKSSMRSFGNLTTAVQCAIIDSDLATLLRNSETRDLLKVVLLDTYFGISIYETIEDELFDGSILHESSETYREQILSLKKTADDNLFQEEIFIRSGVFKREIPKIYNFTCAISGMRLDATSNISMIDACHIVPFAESYDDTIPNGIALTPTLHRAFDRGLISISDDYRVIVHSNFKENQNSPFNLSQFHRQEIILPEDAKFYPSLENLQIHRRNSIHKS